MIKKIPAVTIVAACIRAETGVGPSIASGNQVCNKIWADLPIAPIRKKKQIIDKILKIKKDLKNKNQLEKKNGIIAKITENS